MDQTNLVFGSGSISEWLMKAASVSWILGVCSQFNLETERESISNISAWVQPCLSPVTVFENFFPFAAGRTQNGKLSKLVSEEDRYLGENCAKIARLVC